MALLTPRFKLPTPIQVDRDDVPASVLALATAIDNNMLGFTQGTLAARPAGGTTYGKYYYATDTGFVYQYQQVDANAPAGWRQVGTLPTVPVARWHNVSSQLGAGDLPDVTMAWHQEDFQRNGFNTSGPFPQMPFPGMYRISGQIAFVHMSSVRWQQEQYVVAVYGRNDDGSRGSLLSYDQMTGDAINTLGSVLHVPFHVTAAFDLTANHKAFEVALSTSYPSNPPSDTLTLYVQPGVDNTFLDLAFVCDI